MNNLAINAQRRGRLGLSIAAALACATLAPVALAQPSAGDTPAGRPLYRIEVVVFAYRAGDPSEEDFAHIARREAAESSVEPGALDVFDFTPYVDEQDPFDDPGADPSSRLQLGRDDEDSSSPPARSGIAGADVEADSPADSAARDPAEPGSSASPPSGSADPADAGPTDAGIPGAADGGAGDPAAADAAAALDDATVDPFGNAPDNAVAPFRFRLLREDELELGDVRRRLENLDAYTPLLHGGWIQEGLPPEQARPFDLAYLGASTPSGTIRLHVSRFLHLTLDLDFRPLAAGEAPPTGAPDGAAAAQDGAFGGDRRSLPGFGAAQRTLSDVEVSRRYHLNAERRIRSGEVHYFDHPLFGVIAVVEPYEPPEPPRTEGVRPAA